MLTNAQPEICDDCENIGIKWAGFLYAGRNYRLFESAADKEDFRESLRLHFFFPPPPSGARSILPQLDENYSRLSWLQLKEWSYLRGRKWKIPFNYKLSSTHTSRHTGHIRLKTLFFVVSKSDSLIKVDRWVYKRDPCLLPPRLVLSTWRNLLWRLRRCCEKPGVGFAKVYAVVYTRKSMFTTALSWLMQRNNVGKFSIQVWRIFVDWKFR